MPKNMILTLSVLIIAIFSIGFGFLQIYPKLSNNLEMKEIKVLNKLPIEIERTNPVPQVRNWISNSRSYYYFNWGLKPTSGYHLSLLSVDDHKIKIQAFSPDKDSINAQVITYPHLLLSLPKGDYRFEVFDDHRRPLKNIFRPKNPPLKFSIFIPSGFGGISQREVLRDPYLNNDGKTTTQIALEALFAQDEMMEYLDHDVTFEGVSFSKVQKKWSILLSRGYQTLSKPEKKLLNQLITKNVLSIKATATNPENVEITTNPSRLPSLKN